MPAFDRVQNGAHLCCKRHYGAIGFRWHSAWVLFIELMDFRPIEIVPNSAGATTILAGLEPITQLGLCLFSHRKTVLCRGFNV